MNYRKLLILLFMYVLTILVWLKPLHGQEVIPKRYLSDHDKEQIKQAEQVNQEASALFSKAEDLYSKLKALKKKEDSSFRRIRRMREKALKKDIEGFEKEKKANKLIYSVYEKHYHTFEATTSKETPDLLKAYLQYEQAGRLFYRAAILRNEAYNHVKDLKDKFSKLAKAQHIEEQGLKNMRSTLQRIYERKKSGFQNILDTTSPDDRVVINESLLREIRKAMKQYKYEPSIYSELSRIRMNDTVTFSRIHDFVVQYRRSVGSTQKSMRNRGPIQPAGPTAKENTSPNQDANPMEDHASKENNNSSTDKTGRLSFRVQIATDRKSLSQAKLRKLYSGKKKIYSLREGGWHKYLIGQFSSYPDACRFRTELELKDAFILAFRGNKHVSPSKIEDESGPSLPHSPEKNWKKSQSSPDNREKMSLQNTTSPINTTVSGKETGVVFRVQIAADRIRIEPDQLHSIYSGTQKIHLNKAEGWYRYAVGTCRTYDQARRLQRHIPVKGSWIVAYKEGERYNGYRMRDEHPSYPAPTIRKKIAQQEGILFKVQIAASRVPMSSSELKHIYCGKKVVTEIQQDKYYKYSIGGYDNYKDAARLKKNLCVPGAFVVAFKQDRPLDIQKAINQNK